jgi:hypothetical protein
MALKFDTPNLRMDAGHRFDASPVPAPSLNLKSKRPMNKIKLELGKKTPAQKITLGETHDAAMTGNAAFPTATRIPADAAYQAILAELVSAEADVNLKKVALKQALETRDTKEGAFDVAITSRANYCEAAQPNDDAALASAGLPLRGVPVPVGDLAAPANLVATAGDNEGEADLSCDPVNGARSYEWQCRLHSEPGNWQPVKSSTASSITVTGLTPGALYAFRARGIGATGNGPWSDEAVKRAP